MSGNFDFIGGHYLRGIEADAVEIGVLFTERVRRMPARTVVIVGFNQPSRELVETLVPGNRWQVHVIGDVQGRSGIMNAIHSGAALGRAL